MSEHGSDIPRQPANTVLTLFAQQAGMGLTANRVIGKHTVADGVKILLEGLGLEVNLKAGQLTVRVAENRGRRTDA